MDTIRIFYCAALEILIKESFNEWDIKVESALTVNTVTVVVYSEEIITQNIIPIYSGLVTVKESVHGLMKDYEGMQKEIYNCLEKLRKEDKL